MTDNNQLKLIIEDDDGRRNIVPIELGEISIGRQDGNTIRLKERNVSRRHARIYKDSNIIWAEDLDSYNGVWINGNRVKGKQEVQDGDVIAIGDFHLEVKGLENSHKSKETTECNADTNLEVTQPDIAVPQSRRDTSESAPPSAALLQREPTAIIRQEQMTDVNIVSKTDAQPITQSEIAKLVCVSSHLPGKKFLLDKVEMVIGRTNENDITVDHRSVSRNHAKITYSDNQYKIMDLNSANGVFLNSEMYAKADLKSGDIVELGHIKFRFVPAGENFIFKEEETAEHTNTTVRSMAVRMPDTLKEKRRRPTKRRSRLLFVTILGLLIAIVIMAVTIFGRKQQQNSIPADDSRLSTRSDSISSQSTTQSLNQVEKLYAGALQAFSQRRWAQTRALCTEVLTINKKHQECQSLWNKASQEEEAQRTYNLGVNAINHDDWAQAWNHLQEIPTASYYFSQSSSLIKQVREALVTAKITEGEQAIKEENWEQCEIIADEIASLDPDRTEIEKFRQAARDGKKYKASSMSAGKSKNKPARQKSGKKKIKSSSGGTSSSDTGGDAKEDPKLLYALGAKFVSNAQYQKAIEYFSRCLKADRYYCQCHRALGIAYARLGHGARAYKYYKQYLNYCPNAPDAADVKKLIQPYENAQKASP